MSEAVDPDWLLAPDTVALRRSLEKRQKNALDSLVGAAAVSSDPAVRSAYSSYQSIVGTLAMIGAKNG